MTDGSGRDGTGKGRSLGAGAALAVAVGAALWQRRRHHRPGPHRRSPVTGRRAVRVAGALVELAPVLAVGVFAGALFGLGWVFADLWYVGLIVLLVAGVGFVVWCTRVIPWPRE